MTAELGSILRDTKMPVRRPGLSDCVRIAGNRTAFYRDGSKLWDGWINSNGKVYLLCPLHCEKTPSLVVYKEALRCSRRIFSKDKLEEWRAAMRALPYKKGHLKYFDTVIGLVYDSVSYPHFHCYGCGWSGSRTKLLRFFRSYHGLTLQQIRRREEDKRVAQYSQL